VGICAPLSFTVSQRAREIAVRAALGGTPRSIVVAVFSRAVLQIVPGVVIGAVIVEASGDARQRIATRAAVRPTVLPERGTLRGGAISAFRATSQGWIPAYACSAHRLKTLYRFRYGDHAWDGSIHHICRPKRIAWPASPQHD
jgi:hypothetical protein